jgi:beta-lactamase regulating signal transducer with metallopeptidase domain/protocatechuate 3,4-dioxygenase beta subunit
MNEIVSTSADAAVRYLLVGSVAAAILVPLAWLAIRTTRLRAPVYRHAIWFYCLVGTVALPAIRLHGPKLLLPVLPARAQVSEAPAPPQTQPQRVQASGTPALPQVRAETAEASTQEPWVAPVQSLSPGRPVSRTATVSWKVVIAGAWLAGFAIMLIRLAIEWQRLRRICRSATPIEPGELAADFSGRKLGIRLTDHLQGPVCFGILRPVILLPRQMYQDASSKDLRMVLTHELAHVDRRDCWVNLFQRLLEAVFFFHSLVWLASRQLTHERERICDNWVLARGVCVDDYMRLLSDIGERVLMKTRHLPSVALFEGGLLSRVRSLLDPEHSRITRMTRRSAWTCALSFMLCFAALGTVRLGARPNPGVSSMPATAAMLTSSGLSQAGDANDTSFRPQREYLGQSERRPNGNCSLGGRVISDVTGEPVDNATVYLFYIPTHDAIFIDAASDGSFLFKDIAAGEYALRTTHTAGYQDTPYNPENKKGNLLSFTLREGEHRTDIVFKAKPACTISGIVLDEDGRPLSSKEVSIVAWQEKDETGNIGVRFAIVAMTPGPVGEGGLYSIDGLDARPTYVMALDWRAQDKDDPYPPCYYPGTVDRNKATMVSFDNASVAENIDIRLQKRGEYALEGTITDESTGNPIAKALVVVHRVDMLFDRVTAYTDAQGHYRIDSLAPGEFLVHVDAKPFGFVRKRQTLTIDSETKVSRLDFSLKPGVTIRGKFVHFVDGTDKELEVGPTAYGTARHEPHLNSQPGSWSGVRNRYTVAERKHAIFYEGGAGDYEEECMDFPTLGTFVIEGMLPGQILLSFEPKASDAFVQAILCKGQNVLGTTFDTQADREIQDITIVIGRPPQPPAPR